MSDRPETTSLSAQLKHLDQVQPALAPADFGIDDIVRGGQRRRRNRTITQAAAAIIGVAAVSIAGVTALSAPDTRVDTPAAPPAVTSPPQAPLLDLSGAKVRFTQSGAVMKAVQKSAVVASVTLTSATYTDNAVHAVFTVDSERSVRMNTGNFKVFVDDGDAGFDDEKVITLPAGSHTVKLDATEIGSQPRGIGWDTVNGDGGVVWERP